MLHKSTHNKVAKMKQNTKNTHHSKRGKPKIF